MKTDNTPGQQRAVPNIPSYPHASRLCASHGSGFSSDGSRKIYARNTYSTRDSQEQVQQYYSQQFGQPVQAGTSSSWHQETDSGNQHIMIQLTVESPQTDQPDPQTVIKSYCVITVNHPASKQAG